MREAQELPNEPVILLLHTSNPRTAQEVRDTNSTVKKSACNYTVGPLYPRVPYLQIQTTRDLKYFKKIPDSSKKQNVATHWLLFP